MFNISFFYHKKNLLITQRTYSLKNEIIPLGLSGFSFLKLLDSSLSIQYKTIGKRFAVLHQFNCIVTQKGEVKVKKLCW
jgi:hypothetical protein